MCICVGINIAQVLVDCRTHENRRRDVLASGMAKKSIASIAKEWLKSYQTKKHLFLLTIYSITIVIYMRDVQFWVINLHIFGTLVLTKLNNICLFLAQMGSKGSFSAYIFLMGRELLDP